MNSENYTEGCCEDGNNMSFIEETHTKVDFFLKKEPFTAENITIKTELDDFDNRKIVNEVDQDWDQKSTIKIHSLIKNEEENLETHTELDYFTAESITVKRELDDFDTRKIANEVDQDLDQKSTIKSEEERKQNLISQEEVDIKSEDDEEQLDIRLKNHESKDQINIHKCPDCPYQSKQRSHLNQHSLRHRKPDEIEWHRCTDCPFKTIWKHVLKRHCIVHNDMHGKTIPWIRCPEPDCHYNTQNKRNLKPHLVVHSNHHFFKRTCQTKRRQSLKMHQLKQESTDKWHACPQCPYKTIRKGCLNNHVRMHANPAELEWYMCEQCPFKTYRDNILRKHVAFTHNKNDNGVRCHKCPECPYKATHRVNLERHAKCHKAADQTGWLQCSECSYRTRFINHLKVHQILHTGVVEWFRCFDCPYKTNWKPSLVSHMKMHLHTGKLT